MNFHFVKMQGCGNDFLIMDYFGTDPMDLRPNEIRFLCDRHFGFGADGLVVLCGSEVAHAAWKFFNSDGSEAEMCGNAARCVIRLLAEKHYPSETAPLSLETKAGIIRGRKMDDQSIEITLHPESGMKFESEQKIIKTEKDVFEGYFINTGVPHFVLEVKDLYSYPIDEVGALFVKHEAFQPSGTNVTFFQRVVGPRIRSTTFERGVEKETLACGTGVAAAAIIYSELYLQAMPIEVNVPGGDLTVDISPVSKMLLLRGPAEYVFSGECSEIPQNFEERFQYGAKK
jgi:diaminopimelate epimerase